MGLYYIADQKLLELGLLDNEEAYKAQYYSYMMNGLLTQQVRIKPGKQIEESHMQNRALIAQWALELGKDDNVVELVTRKDEKTGQSKTFVRLMTMKLYGISLLINLQRYSVLRAKETSIWLVL